MHIDRSAELTELIRLVQTGNCVVVGPPGVGKTYLLKGFCRRLIDDGFVCLYLPIDKVNIRSDTDTQALLRIPQPLPDHLKTLAVNSPRPLFVVVDAFDAARSADAQDYLLSLLAQLSDLGGKCRLVVSARSYDARRSRRLRALFPAAGGADPRFQDAAIDCRHFNLPLLTDAEVERVAQSIPGLLSWIPSASTELRRLLRAPFNLWLVEQVVDSADVGLLSGVRVETDLLGLFWQRRVRESPDGEDASAIATRVARQMLNNRQLSVRVEDVYPLGYGSAWTRLFSDGVLEAHDQTGQRIGFAHNILFDYAVSILLIEDDAEAFHDFLVQDAARPLFIRPSIDYYLTRQWVHSPIVFWSVVWRMFQASTTEAQVYARILPATVIAREVRSLEELRPLLDAVDSRATSASLAALSLFQIVRASVHRQRDQLWADVAASISRSIHPEFAWELGAVMYGISSAHKDDPGRFASQGSTVGLNLFHWAQTATDVALQYRDSVAATWAVPLLLRHYASAVTQSQDVIRTLLTRLTTGSLPLSYLTRLTDEIDALVGAAPNTVAEIYETVFSYEETSNSPTSFGTPILPLNSTRRQDYSLCQFRLARHFPAFLRAAPDAATRAALRSLNAYIIREHVERYLNPGFTVENVTCTMRFRGSQATFVRDGSHIWAKGGRDRALEIADHLFRWLSELLDREEAAAVSDVLDAFATHARVAYLWVRLLTLASSNPKQLGRPLLDVAASPCVLRQPEALVALGAFIETVVPTLSPGESERLEGAVIESVDSIDDPEDRQRRLDRFLARFPPLSLATVLGRERRAELERLGTLPPNAPLVSFTSSGRNFTVNDHLREIGVNPDAETNRALLQATEPLEGFKQKFMNGIPGFDDIVAILPVVLDVHRQIAEPASDAAPQVLEAAWTRLAEAAALVARGISTTADAAFATCRQVLLEGVAKDPSVERDRADDSYVKAHWSPSPATEAAQGLGWLARLEADSEILEAIKRLCTDARPAVRFLAVRELIRLSETAPTVIWEIARERIANDTNVVVQDALCRLLGQLLSAHETDARPLLMRLGDRILERDRDLEALETLISIVTWLAVSKEDSWANDVLGRLILQPHSYTRALGHASFQLGHNLSEQQIRVDRSIVSRSVGWLLRTTEAAFHLIAQLRRDSRALTANGDGEKDDAERTMYLTIQNIGASLRRALETESATRETQVLYAETRIIADHVIHFGAQGFLLAPIAHDIMEYLQKSLDFDPAATLRRAAALLQAAESAGYNLEPMAADDAVEIVERMLADYRSVLREPDTLSSAVVLLDCFAKVGHSEPLRLLQSLDEVFR